MDKNLNDKELEFAVKPIESEPETSFDMVNKYGTYEIQPTCERQNEWPTIAQGVPKDYIKPTVKKKKFGVQMQNEKY